MRYASAVNCCVQISPWGLLFWALYCCCVLLIHSGDLKPCKTLSNWTSMTYKNHEFFKEEDFQLFQLHLSQYIYNLYMMSPPLFISGSKGSVFRPGANRESTYCSASSQTNYAWSRVRYYGKFCIVLVISLPCQFSIPENHSLQIVVLKKNPLLTRNLSFFTSSL